MPAVRTSARYVIDLALAVVGESRAKDPIRQRQFQALGISLIGLLLACVLTTGTLFFVGMPRQGLLVLGGMLCGFLLLIHLRRTRDVRLTTHLSVWVIVAVLVIRQAQFGGLEMVGQAWLYLPPMLAGLILGIRGAALYTAVLIAQILIFAILESLGVVFVAPIAPSDRIGFTAVVQILFAVALFIIVAAFLWAQQAADRALREQEARTRSILETVADAIIVFDERGVIESFNASAERIFRYARGEVLGRPFSMLTVDGEASASMVLPSPAFERDSTLGVGREIAGRRKDGTTFPMEIALSELRIGTQRRFTGAIRDITVRKHVQQTLAKARDAALASTQARSAFLANVSHEIRTPINIIFGMLEMIDDAGELNVEQRDFLDRAQEAARNLLTVLDETLDLSKIEAGMMSICAVDLDLRQVVAQVADLLGARAAQKNLAFRSSVAADVPERLRGDPGRLRQILLNLVGNAIKFTDAGEVSIAATLVTDAPDCAQVRLSVQDTGIGIPEEAQEAIFDSYIQADTAVARRYGGTGLGLAICKQLTRLMGGTIGVRSAPDSGSEFWVEIPLVKSAAAVAASDTREPHALAS